MSPDEAMGLCDAIGADPDDMRHLIDRTQASADTVAIGRAALDTFIERSGPLQRAVVPPPPPPMPVHAGGRI